MSATTCEDRVTEIKGQLREAEQKLRGHQRSKDGNAKALRYRQWGTTHRSPKAELGAGGRASHLETLIAQDRKNVERLQAELAAAEGEQSAATATRRLVEARLVERTREYEEARLKLRRAIGEARPSAKVDPLEHDAALLFTKCQVLSAIVQDLQ